MVNSIHVEEEALNDLRHSLETAGQQYKENLGKLTRLIHEITTGSIQGDLAQDLLLKFNEKKDDFYEILKALEEAEEYSGAKGSSFVNMINDLKESAN